MRKLSNLLITGGAGFIGSNFIRYILKEIKIPGRIVNIDKLTYAGNLDSLKDIHEEFGNSQYFFIQQDICNLDKINEIIHKFKIDTIINFAAESHVDRSICSPKEFINTNIIGTFTLLESIREIWKDKKDVLFHHISTDEVYGSLGQTGQFFETTPYSPRNPYSASKASSDHLVQSYFYTFNIPITISNCSNNYGPYQFPEKMIPLMILNTLREKKLPVYGDGKNIRDWLYVDDHCSGIWKILQKGKPGEKYNIGGENEIENIELVNIICEKMSKINQKNSNYYKKLIKFVKDRPGHDRRYSINCEKIKKELGWIQKTTFNEGIEKTINWYLKHLEWVKSIENKKYLKWIKQNYEKRD